MESILEKSIVESLIPQKEPFVMVDKLFAFGENTLTSGLTIDTNNIFVENGRFNESGIVEHMAQSVALYTGYQFYLNKQSAPEGYIGSVKDVEILELPLPGEDLVTEVNVIQEFIGVTLVDIVTRCNTIKIASGQMKTVLAK
jgi:predicted hotdog family 3-hydroxylacyl-ACP dehydratase